VRIFCRRNLSLSVSVNITSCCSSKLIGAVFIFLRGSLKASLFSEGEAQPLIVAEFSSHKKYMYCSRNQYKYRASYLLLPCASSLLLVSSHSELVSS